MSSQLLRPVPAAAPDEDAPNDEGHDDILLSLSGRTPSATTFPALPGTPGRGLSWAALALALAILALAVTLAQLVGKPSIEETLVDRVETRLTEAGVTDLEVRADGRNVTITGPQARKSEAFVAETEGVHSVTVESTATEAASDLNETETTETADEVGQAQLRLNTGADTIVLQGTVPDEAARDLVAQAAGTVFSRVEDRLDIGSDDADWTPGLMDAISELSKVTNGSLVLDGDVVTLDGAVVDDVSRTEIGDAFTNAAPQLRLVNNLTVDPDATAQVPLTDEQAAMAEALEAPQRQIDALLQRANQGPAMFATDSPRLSPAGVAVVDEIAEVLTLAFREAPAATVAIGGHTDSTGSRVYNQDLSQRRADSVMRRLIAEGLPGRRLQAVGHGPDQPIADNATPAGRAQNRRIAVELTLPEQS